MNRSVRPGGGLRHQEKKGPLTVSPRENKIETEIANERMNRVGDGDDDDDDGRYTKNTYLTLKKRKERKKDAKVHTVRK